jgi:hypothetical protein
MPSKNKAQRAKNSNKWRENNPEKARLVAFNSYWKHREKRIIALRRRTREIRLRVLLHYSPNLICQRCGFSDERALSIHHVNHDGAAHRKQLSKRFKSRSLASNTTYRWLIEQNFPDGFKVYCMNCQSITEKEFRAITTHHDEI